MIATVAALLLTPAPPRAAVRCEDSVDSSTPLSRAQTLETMLSLAVATEQYEEAARLRDELASLGVDTELAVLQANDKFYRSASTSRWTSSASASASASRPASSSPAATSLHSSFSASLHTPYTPLRHPDTP